MRYRDTIAFRVYLEHGSTFDFEVQDWDIGERPLGDDEVLDLARGLIVDGVPLISTKRGWNPSLTMRIDIHRVVAIAIMNDQCTYRDEDS